MQIRISALIFSAVLLCGCARADEIAKHALPSPVVDESAGSTTETAVFAGGCFWGMQGVFQHVKGVSAVVSGYSGGSKPEGGYEEVSTGTTGNAESIRIIFDPHQVSFGQLLRVLFSVMDPTALDYQGPDQGTQYRSAVFATSLMQAKIAHAYIAQLTKARRFGAPIVTEVTPFKAFFQAEDYHQDYLIHHPDQPYIAYNDLPKVAALKSLYPMLWREKPVMVFASRKSEF